MKVLFLDIDGPFLLDGVLHTPELKAWREKYT